MNVSKTEKRKILIFSTAYFPFIGGAEVAVKTITDLSPNCSFDMVTARFDKELPKFERIGNVNVYRVGLPLGNKNKFLREFGNFLYIAFGFWKAVFLQFKNKYDMTWSIMAAYAGAISLFFKIFHPSIPFLLTLQEGDAPDYIKKRVGWYRLPIWKLLFKVPTRIQVISNFLADWAKENGAKCQIDVVPNGVNTRQFSISNPPAGGQFSNNFKNELKIKSEDKILITTSRLVEKNGVGDVITAMQHLSENYKFLVLGVGPLEFDLKFKIKNLKLDGRVLMLGDVDYNDIFRYLNISDVFVRSSLSEGLGNSFLEAMAAGVPVIGTKVGGIPDFLKNGETGLFCEVNNPRDIAEKVQFILDPKNNKLKNQIITNAKKLVEEKYDWNIIAEKMKRVFNEII